MYSVQSTWSTTVMPHVGHEGNCLEEDSTFPIRTLQAVHPGWELLADTALSRRILAVSHFGIPNNPTQNSISYPIVGAVNTLFHKRACIHYSHSLSCIYALFSLSYFSIGVSCRYTFPFSEIQQVAGQDDPFWSGTIAYLQEFVLRKNNFYLCTK